MTFPKTSLAVLALLMLAACKKNDHEIFSKEESVKASPSQNSKPTLLTEATQIKPFWERSQSVSAGVKGNLSIVPFDESQLFKTDKVQRRMLILNDDKSNPMYIELYTDNRLSDATLNSVVSNFISFDKTVSQRMITEFEGTIIVYDKNRKSREGYTYNKKYKQPGSAVLSIDNSGSKMALPPAGEECWYLVLTSTYVQYFSDGTYYTWSESQIVGQFCTSTNTVSGGGSNTCNNTAADMAAGAAVSENSAVTTVTEGPETRTKIYVWKFYRQNQGMWYFESAEKGTHVKVNNVWKWQSLTHESITRSGFLVGGSADCLLVSAASTLGSYWAAMELKYKIKVDLVCEGSPFSYTTGTKTSVNYFDVNS